MLHRLYYLLGERTRQDHLDMEGKVRVARATKDDAVEDHATLTQMMHDMRAANEDAERQLAQMKKILEDAKKDWMKKMKDRKKEVQELKRRQEREELKELKRCVPSVSVLYALYSVPVGGSLSVDSCLPQPRGTSASVYALAPVLSLGCSGDAEFPVSVFT